MCKEPSPTTVLSKFHARLRGSTLRGQTMIGIYTPPYLYMQEISKLAEHWNYGDSLNEWAGSGTNVFNVGCSRKRTLRSRKHTTSRRPWKRLREAQRNSTARKKLYTGKRGKGSRSAGCLGNHHPMECTYRKKGHLARGVRHSRKSRTLA